MVASVRTPRVYEHIVAQIERAIFDGGLREGDKLPAERQLAQQFGASRVAVREALRALEHRGLVEVRQGAAGGSFLRAVDASPVRRDFATLFRRGRLSSAQLAEARLLIEPDVAALAARRATEADLDALNAAIEGRPVTARDLDIRFHRLVAEAARNAPAAVVVDVLLEVEADVAPPLEPTADDGALLEAAHRSILDAIKARQPGQARAAMAGHIAEVHRRLRRAEERAATR
jgi:GntR family transcriptional repressor for pyruvate dehydrogenase complex